MFVHLKQSVPVLVLEALRRRNDHFCPKTPLRRLNAMVRFARTASPFYRELYRGVPEQIDNVAVLPPVTKAQLMANFDRWVTDPSVTHKLVEAFTATPPAPGRLVADHYLLETTSGTTGTPGYFLKDSPDLRVSLVTNVMSKLGWLDAGDLVRLLRSGGRTAMIAATNGHYMVSSATAWMQGGHPGLRHRLRLFSVHEPMPRLVAQLNEFQPSYLLVYGATARLLAAEQQAGRLRIHPVLLEPAGETVTATQQREIAKSFGCKVRMMYACSEVACATDGVLADGWWRVNSDWAIIEPVEADHRPTPAGVPSSMSLFTNLANRIAPLIRYEVSDSILQRPDTGGDSYPKIRIEGRSGDILQVPDGRGGTVSLPALALNTIVDQVGGVAQYQVLQVTPDVLELRVVPATDTDATDIALVVQEAITTLLNSHGVRKPDVRISPAPPQQGRGGKVQSVVPYLAASHPVTARGLRCDRSDESS